MARGHMHMVAAPAEQMLKGELKRVHVHAGKTCSYDAQIHGPRLTFGLTRAAKGLTCAPALGKGDGRVSRAALTMIAAAAPASRLP